MHTRILLRLAVLMRLAQSRFVLALLFTVLVIIFSAYWLFSPVYENIVFSTQETSVYNENNRTGKILEARVANTGLSSVWYWGYGDQIADVQLFRESEDSLTWVESITLSPADWIKLPAGSEASLVKPLNELQGDYKVRFEIRDWRGKRKNVDAKLTVSPDDCTIERQKEGSGVRRDR